MTAPALRIARVDDGPTLGELDRIDGEWPTIAAALAELDAELDRCLSDMDRHRIERARQRAIQPPTGLTLRRIVSRPARWGTVWKVAA